MKLSHRNKKANKHGIPQRQYAARQARKLRQQQQRLRWFARRQHRRFHSAMEDVFRKAFTAALVSSLCSHRVFIPVSPMRPVGFKYSYFWWQMTYCYAEQRYERIQKAKQTPEKKPSLWQRAKGVVSRWFERSKLSENPAM